jgi:FkbM family methyltransferase
MITEVREKWHGARHCLRALRDPQRHRVKPWFAVNGDKTLRLSYPLGPDSVVFDVGGYEGQWSSDIYAMYRSNIYVFEPVSAFYRAISERFARNPAIRCYPFGLAGSDRTAVITLAADASGVFAPAHAHDARETITLRALDTFLQEQPIETIDLIKINIEGGEYELLEHILDRGLSERIADIQVQFHPIAPNAYDRMKQIQERLARTHHTTYAFEFVWENWRRL